MCKHSETPNPRGPRSAPSLTGFCFLSIIPVVRPPCRQGAEQHANPPSFPLPPSCSHTCSHTHIWPLISPQWIYSISYFRHHLVLIYRSGEGVLDQARLNSCQSHRVWSCFCGLCYTIPPEPPFYFQDFFWIFFFVAAHVELSSASGGTRSLSIKRRHPMASPFTTNGNNHLLRSKSSCGRHFSKPLLRRG